MISEKPNFLVFFTLQIILNINIKNKSVLYRVLYVIIKNCLMILNGYI